MIGGVEVICDRCGRTAVSHSSVVEVDSFVTVDKVKLLTRLGWEIRGDIHICRSCIDEEQGLIRFRTRNGKRELTVLPGGKHDR